MGPVDRAALPLRRSRSIRSAPGCEKSSAVRCRSGASQTRRRGFPTRVVNRATEALRGRPWAQSSHHAMEQSLMKRSLLAVAVGAMLAIGGCGRANPIYVEAAIGVGIYKDRAFFDAVCGFPLDPMYTATTHVEVSEIDAPKTPWGSQMVPATAKLHLTGVHRAGVGQVLTCDARVGFKWGQKSEAVTKGWHREGDRNEWYEASDFKRL